MIVSELIDYLKTCKQDGQVIVDVGEDELEVDTLDQDIDNGDVVIYTVRV